MLQNGIETFVERRSSRSQADAFSAFQPFFLNVRGVFDVISVTSKAPGGAGELGGVIGIFPADGKNEIGFATKVVKSSLSFLGGITNRVHVNHLDFRPLPPDFSDQGVDVIDRLCRLGDEPDFWRGECGQHPGDEE